MKSLHTLLFSIILALSSFAQTDQTDDKEMIAKNGAQFSQYIMDADIDKIMDSYTADAKIFPGRQDIIEGYEGIREYWTRPDDVEITHHKLTVLEVQVCGDEARDHGYYEGTTRQADGTESSWRGKYVVVWKKVDGEWKMYLDIWNSIAQE